MRGRNLITGHNFSDYIESTIAADSEDALFGVYKKALESLGYDRVIFSLMNDHSDLNLKAGHGIMQNYPDDWMKHYVAHGYEKHDPIRSFIFSEAGPFMWDKVPTVIELSRKQKACLNGGIEAGLNNGTAVALRGPNGNIAAVGCASSHTDKLNPTALWMMNAYSQQFYAAYTSLMAQPDWNEERLYLTDREREVLTWCAAGKSTWDIGAILGISDSTVKFHLKKIFAKLDTNNRNAAIVKALFRGLITT